MADRRSRAFVGLLGALTAFGPLATDLYLPGLPALRSDLHASASAAQLTVTACLIGLGVGQLAAGPISDVLGRRGPLLAGLVVFVVASLGCAAAPSVWPLVAVRFVQGAAGAAGVAIARAIVRDRHDPVEAARMLAVLFSINSVVPIIAPLLGGQLLHVMSWRGVFVVLAGIGAALLVATTLSVRESLAPEARRVREPGGGRRVLGELLHDGTFVGCVLASGLAMAAMFAYIAGSPFVLQDIHGLSPQTYSLVFAANAAGILGASRISVALAARTPEMPRRLLTIGAATSAAGALLVLVSVLVGLGLAALLAGLFICVASVGLVVPNAAALALAGHPSVAGTASGIFGMTGFVLGAAVAPLVGLGGVHDALPMGIAMAAAGVAGLGVAVLLVHSRPISASVKARPPGGQLA